VGDESTWKLFQDDATGSSRVTVCFDPENFLVMVALANLTVVVRATSYHFKVISTPFHILLC